MAMAIEEGDPVHPHLLAAEAVAPELERALLAGLGPRRQRDGPRHRLRPVVADHRIRIANLTDGPLLDPQRPVADVDDLVEIVRREDEGRSAPAQALDVVDALALEGEVT